MNVARYPRISQSKGGDRMMAMELFCGIGGFRITEHSLRKKDNKRLHSRIEKALGKPSGVGS
jgi:hypothetical protein